MAKEVDFDELEGLYKQLLTTASNLKGGEQVKKFLKKEATTLSRYTKAKAKSLGVMEQTGNYYKSFKSGKVYKYSGNGAWTCRSINSSPHAHLIEYGYIVHTKEGDKFIPGFYPFQKSEQDFENNYFEDTEKFIEELLDEGLDLD